MAVLGLRRMPSAEELHSAYRAAARATHPDNGGSKEKFVAVREAYDTLRSPEKLRKWLTEYKAHCERAGLEVCKQCLAATSAPVRDCACGAKQTKTTGAAASQVRDALADELADFVVRVSTKVGDQVADLAISLVDRGVNSIHESISRKRRGK